MHLFASQQTRAINQRGARIVDSLDDTPVMYGNGWIDQIAA